jgi:hypothetical protein
VFGDTVGTWTRDQKNSLATYLISRSEFADGFDAFAFGFPSELVRAGSFTVPDAAKALSTEISYRSFLTKYRRIVIVAHSMGGLVALEALTTFAELRDKVPLLVTFATPYEGTQVTRLARELLRNPAIEDMLPRNDNSFLASLSNRWKEAKKAPGTRTTVLCAYEMVGFPGLGLIVPQSSATSLCDGTADPIGDDHIGLIKPDSAEHQSVKILVNALRSLAQVQPPVAKPDPSNVPTIVNLYHHPPGYALASVTVVSFHVQGSNPAGQLMNYTWDLGDGTILSGARVDHTYSTAGDFKVTVTASTSGGAQARHEITFPVRSLTGDWAMEDGRGQYQLVQSGASLAGKSLDGGGVVSGGVYPNRTRTLQTDWAGYVQLQLPSQPKPMTFDGWINPAINQLILDGGNQVRLRMNRVSPN